MDMTRILVAVDNFSTEAYLKDLFKHYGIRANWAWGWNGTVLHLERGAYDALLLDDLLIPPDVRSPARWLRARGHEIPVITMVEHPALRRAREAGEIAIGKPVSPIQLMEALAAAVGDAEGRQDQAGEMRRRPASRKSRKFELTRRSRQRIRTLERSVAS